MVSKSFICVWFIHMVILDNISRQIMIQASQFEHTNCVYILSIPEDVFTQLFRKKFKQLRLKV